MLLKLIGMIKLDAIVSVGLLCAELSWMQPHVFNGGKGIQSILCILKAYVRGKCVQFKCEF